MSALSCGCSLSGQENRIEKTQRWKKLIHVSSAVGLKPGLNTGIDENKHCGEYAKKKVKYMHRWLRKIDTGAVQCNRRGLLYFLGTCNFEKVSMEQI